MRITIGLIKSFDSSKAPVETEAKNIRLSAGAYTTPKVGMPFSISPIFTVNEPKPSFFKELFCAIKWINEKKLISSF